MTRFLCFVCAVVLAPAAVIVLPSLHAQIDSAQSNVPEAGFGSPPEAVPALGARSIALPPNTPTPTIHVYSRETIVDVLVTDDKGQPVLGLKQSDFTVKEDGQVQPIRSFREYSEESTAAAPPTLPPDTWSNSTTLPTSGPVQIFLFDVQASSPDDMERSKKYIADYLRFMPTGTQVALFDLSPSKGLRLLQGFTSEGPLAASIVDKLDPEWIRIPGDPRPMAIAGMNQIAAYLAGVHGRKNLIWICHGAPSVMVTRDGGLSWYSGVAPDMTIVHQSMDIYDLFTREQIAIYPVDPAGVHLRTTQDLMAEDVASSTGGATSNSNDYKAIVAKIVGGTEHFYTLSYIPPRPNDDGHFRPIVIAVGRPDLHLSYRTGYNDEQPNPPDDKLKADMIQGPMRLGALPATQLLFTLKVTRASTGQAEATAPQVHITDKHRAGSAKDRPYNAVFTFDPTQIAFSEAPATASAPPSSNSTSGYSTASPSLVPSAARPLP